MIAVKILIAEDDNESRKLLIDFLKEAGFDASGVADGEEALAYVSEHDIDVLISDIRMPRVDGLKLLEKVKKNNPGIMVMLITGYANVNSAVQAMKLGAEDYFSKPIDLQKLQVQLNKALERRAQSRDSRRLNQAPEGYRFENIVGNSRAMERVYRMVDKVAASDSTVLIYGESGVGKELIARAIHAKSPRAGNLLVPVNCGAIPEELLESELFGHEKGAFTGAHKTRIGRFEMAHNGTIFLDEIGDMSPNLQVKILRVLQEREFERVGGVRPCKADIRVITATHRNLEAEVEKGRFRQDLFYRLNVIPITIPPLRERTEDIPLLATYFIERFNREHGSDIGGVSDAALECLTSYGWPGNVRELQNIIERIVVLKGSGVVAVDDLPEQFMQTVDAHKGDEMDIPPEGISFNTMVTSFEKKVIMQALDQTSGVKNKAAKLLNMNRTTLVEKMKKLEIQYKP